MAISVAANLQPSQLLNPLQNVQEANIAQPAKIANIVNIAPAKTNAEFADKK